MNPLGSLSSAKKRGHVSKTKACPGFKLAQRTCGVVRHDAVQRGGASTVAPSTETLAAPAQRREVRAA